jgi:hypothetical protein
MTKSVIIQFAYILSWPYINAYINKANLFTNTLKCISQILLTLINSYLYINKTMKLFRLYCYLH